MSEVVKDEDALGLGLVGAGGFGRYCMGHYQQMPEVRLAAAADVNPEAAKATAAEFGIEALSVEALLASDKVDIVHLATPPFTHASLATAALSAGKHVLCEKPLATSTSDARQMLDLAKAQGKLLSVNLIMRYNPLCEAVKRIVDSGLLGAPIHGYFENYAKDEQLGPNHWFWDKSKSGGIFIEHAVHFFDLFSWWLGDGVVEAAQQITRPGGGMVGQVQCTVRYGESGSGQLVNFYHGFTQAERMDRQTFCLLFERGSLRMEEWVPTSIEVDCLASEADAAAIASMIPSGKAETLAAYEGDERKVYSRHQHYEIDGRYLIRGDAGMDKPDLYGHVVKSLLSDQIKAIRDPQHTRRITEQNGLTSLQLAADAERMATA